MKVVDSIGVGVAEKPHTRRVAGLEVLKRAVTKEQLKKWYPDLFADGGADPAQIEKTRRKLHRQGIML
jgi:hypothetical protein